MISDLPEELQKAEEIAKQETEEVGRQTDGNRRRTLNVLKVSTGSIKLNDPINIQRLSPMH